MESNVLSRGDLISVIDNLEAGTLERNGAEFILDTLYDEANMEEISEDKLEKIAGGNICNRAIAASLALGFFGRNVCFDAQAIKGAGKASNSYAVATKSKNKPSGSKRNKLKMKKSVTDSETGLKQLEKQLRDLEKRLEKLECKSKTVRVRKKRNVRKKVAKKQMKAKTVAQKEIASEYTWPAPGYHHIISGFNDKEGCSHVHGAIDIGGDAQHGSIYGASIVAANSGTVIIACTNGYGGGYGNYVVIDHGNGKSTLYGHLSSVSVSKGQKVSRGRKIGEAGSTGFSTGPHLHFEYRVNGVSTDPKNILKY